MQHTQQRIQKLYQHLVPSPLLTTDQNTIIFSQETHSSKLTEKSDSDIVIVRWIKIFLVFFVFCRSLRRMIAT
jgi:hypothetical protein